jgi:hypothetical protein
MAADLRSVLLVRVTEQDRPGRPLEPLAVEIAEDDQPGHQDRRILLRLLGVDEGEDRPVDLLLEGRRHCVQGLAQAAGDVLLQFEGLERQHSQEEVERGAAADLRQRAGHRPLPVEVRAAVERLELGNRRRADRGDHLERVIPQRSRLEHHGDHHLRHLARPQTRQPLEREDAQRLGLLAQAAGEGMDDLARVDPQFADDADRRHPKLKIVRIEEPDQLLGCHIHDRPKDNLTRGKIKGSVWTVRRGLIRRKKSQVIQTK